MLNFPRMGLRCAPLLAVLAIFCHLTGCGKRGPGDASPRAVAVRAGETQGLRSPHLALLAQAVSRSPDNPEVQYQWGMALAEAGDTERAKAAFYRAHGLQSDYKDSLVRLARLMLRSSDLVEVGWAAEHAARTARVKSDSGIRSEALFIVGVCQYRQGHNDAALRSFEEALDLNPLHEAAAINLAVLQYRNGNPEAADRLLAGAVKAAPNSLRARLAFGEFLVARGRYPGAETQFLAAASMDENFPPSAVRLAGVLWRQRKFAESEQIWLRLAKGRDSRYDYVHANYLLNTGRTGSALEELRSLAQDKKPPAVDSRTRWVAALIQTRRLDEAERMVNEWLASQPRNAVALRQSIEIKLLQRSIRDPEKTIETLMPRLDPSSAKMHFLFARLAAAAKNSVRRDFEFREALLRDPNLIGAQVAWTQSLLSEGKVTASLKTIGESEGLQTESGLATAQKNWIRLLTGDRRMAELELDHMNGISLGLSVQLCLLRGVCLNAEDRDAKRWWHESAALVAGGFTRQAVTTLSAMFDPVIDSDLLQLPEDLPPIAFVTEEQWFDLATQSAK